MRRTAGPAALVALLVATVAAPVTRAGGDAGCGRAQPAMLTIEGNLYAVLRGKSGGYVFGGSGPVVSSFQEAIGLVRKLGFRGTDAQLLHRLTASALPGVDFASGGGASDFTVTCGGSYRVTALVRLDRGTITGTRFWLRQGDVHVSRAFCMPEQWVPPGALVSVSFRVPLSRTPPVFGIDWNGDGKIDSVGPFRAGGAGYPSSERCG